MEDVIGGHAAPERFDRYLANWEAVLACRVDEAAAAFSTVKGVRALILAGSIGRGAAWPLSDIDILPIYDDPLFELAQADVERRRVALLGPWTAEGWWTGLDIGKLAFGAADVARVLGARNGQPTEILRDDCWYHALDKGYGGVALYDPEGLAAGLAAWFTRFRFAPESVDIRLARAREEAIAAQQRLHACLNRQDWAGATLWARSAVKWLQTWQLERWGERDNSLGRLGARFARIAVAHGKARLVRDLDLISDLDDISVERRMASAPAWVHERHDRSWRARISIGEALTPLQDARDTLRICSLYAMPRVSAPPYPAWLAIPGSPEPLQIKAQVLLQISNELFTESS